jgi:hypothetical protein
MDLQLPEPTLYSQVRNLQNEKLITLLNVMKIKVTIQQVIESELV